MTGERAKGLDFLRIWVRVFGSTSFKEDVLDRILAVGLHVYIELPTTSFLGCIIDVKPIRRHTVYVEVAGRVPAQCQDDGAIYRTTLS